MIKFSLKYIFLFLLFSLEAQAAYKDNCSNHKLGWSFYCDKKKEAKQKKPEQQEKKIPPQELTLGEIATKKTEDSKKRAEELLNIAIHFPTKENITNYLKFNQKLLDQSSYFAEIAKRSIWQNPEINYNLKRPLNAVGKRAWMQEKNRKELQATTELNEKYGLFFFYRSDCPYCHAYSPVLKRFAKKYDLEVMAVSLDGKKLPEWPNSQTDKGQAKKLGITSVPATIAFDKSTSEIIPIGFGALSQQELMEQIYLLTRTKPGETL